MLCGRLDDALVIFNGLLGVVVGVAGVRSDQSAFSRLAVGGVREHASKNVAVSR